MNRGIRFLQDIIFQIIIEFRRQWASLRGRPLAFRWQGETYYINPDQSAPYVILTSTEKLQCLVDLIPQDAKIIFDVGANCGVFSAFSARRCPDAEIHAFEPTASLLPIIELNRTTAVRINPLGVADTSGTFQLYVNPSSQQTNSFVEDAAQLMAGNGDLLQEEVECTTIDEYCSTHKIEHIDTLKIDVQGFEGKVIKGAQLMMKNVDQLMIESSWMEPETIDLVATLRREFPHAYVVNQVAYGADLLLSRCPVPDNAQYARRISPPSEPSSGSVFGSPSGTAHQEAPSPSS